MRCDTGSRGWRGGEEEATTGTWNGEGKCSWSFMGTVSVQLSRSLIVLSGVWVFLVVSVAVVVCEGLGLVVRGRKAGCMSLSGGGGWK